MFSKECEKYKTQSYWDKRYTTEESYDWFCDPQTLDCKIQEQLKPTDNILVLGCGNSSLSSSLYNKGYPNITNIDFSPVVIEMMKTKHATLVGMSWCVMDMLDLRFDNETFDVVVDKGTIDALQVDQGDVWDPRPEVKVQLDKALSEVSRVLRVGGHFFSVTFSQPHFRGRLLCQSPKYCWNVDHIRLGSGFHYFMYTATKRRTVEEVAMNQRRDYTFSNLYSSQAAVTCLDYDKDNNFLCNIGDVYDVEM